MRTKGSIQALAVLTLGLLMLPSAAQTAIVAPTDISGSVLWLDAADTGSISDTAGLVDQWNDKSAAGTNHVTQVGSARPTTGAATQNGLNVLSFDGNDDLYNTFTNIPVPYTLFVVGKASSGHWVSGIGGGRAVMYLGTGGLRMYAGIDSPWTGVPPYSTAHVGVMATGIDTSTSDWLSYEGGAPQVQNFGNFPLGPNGIRVGREGGGGGALNNGAEVAEVIIYNRTLTPNERGSVNTYLEKKWGDPIARQGTSYIVNTEVGGAGTAFSSGDLVDGGGAWLTSGLNNGGTGPNRTDTWIASTNPGTFGITLAQPTTVSQIAIQTQFSNRDDGDFQVQYTTDGATWNTIGTITKLLGTNDATRGLYEFAPVHHVSGMRVNVTSFEAQTSIAEFQVYSNPYAFTLAETGGVTNGLLDSSSIPPMQKNVALAANGGVAFSQDHIADAGSRTFEAARVNDGLYAVLPFVTQEPWIAGTTGQSFVGVKLAEPTSIDKIAFEGQFSNRVNGTYEFQFTRDDFTGVDLSEPASEVAAMTWETIGIFQVADNDFDLRRMFSFDRVHGVTGVRVLVNTSGSQIAISELEVWQAVPEPSTVLLMGLGVLGLAGCRWRRSGRRR